jgi:glucose-1-phosphate thymidylyltransferase
LITRQAETKADVVLGLFPADRVEKMDMVETDDTGRVLSIIIKPTATSLHLAWVVAIWTPVFTDFLHDYLLRQAKARPYVASDEELSVGHVFQAALRHHLSIASVVFSNGSYLDIGTPMDLIKATQAEGTEDRW